jgi:hypothetical protein
MNLARSYHPSCSDTRLQTARCPILEQPRPDMPPPIHDHKTTMAASARIETGPPSVSPGLIYKTAQALALAWPKVFTDFQIAATVPDVRWKAPGRAGIGLEPLLISINRSRPPHANHLLLPELPTSQLADHCRQGGAFKLS